MYICMHGWMDGNLERSRCSNIEQLLSAVHSTTCCATFSGRRLWRWRWWLWWGFGGCCLWLHEDSSAMFSHPPYPGPGFSHFDWQAVAAVDVSVSVDVSRRVVFITFEGHCRHKTHTFTFTYNMLVCMRVGVCVCVPAEKWRKNRKTPLGCEMSWAEMLDVWCSECLNMWIWEYGLGGKLIWLGHHLCHR